MDAVDSYDIEDLVEPVVIVRTQEECDSEPQNIDSPAVGLDATDWKFNVEQVSMLGEPDIEIDTITIESPLGANRPGSGKPNWKPDFQGVEFSLIISLSQFECLARVGRDYLRKKEGEKVVFEFSAEC